ncbi:OLC1v1014803C1 [Oldenlandia corymbosa var. corymbosa]|uniref:OLC1v1014803C1 n=1 Tax=Oldenlandia corymbosa var. corymbosa TaxID=529605 RepID=A0AAV1E5F2_OLDCO|nr:OLC1v1014803C1 [Oldenlandia corymbosa var. corymbosa]
MENKVKAWRLPPSCVRPRQISEPPVGFQDVSPELSNSSRKRKTASLSSVYSPPRSPLGIIKPSLEIELGCSESKDDFPMKERKCKCKQSRCLKMYCWCFASGQSCNGCSCFDCQNTPGNEDARQAALGSILERNSKSLRKMISTPKFSASNKDSWKENIILVNVGCCCKKSHCIQGYCDCYHAKKSCSEACKCWNCENVHGWKERSSSTPKKLENENFLDLNGENPVNYKIDQSWKVVRQGTTSPLNSSRRLILCGAEYNINQLQNLMEFCELLMGTSEAVSTDFKILSSLGNLDHKQERQNSVAFVDDHFGRQDYQISKLGNHVNCNQDDVLCQDFNSGDFTPKERPMSPKIASFAGEEKDMVSNPDASSSRIRSSGCFSEVYMEQENLILANFRDFLTCLLARGRGNAKG